jgi:hypothetical protein
LQTKLFCSERSGFTLRFQAGARGFLECHKGGKLEQNRNFVKFFELVGQNGAWLHDCVFNLTAGLFLPGGFYGFASDEPNFKK